MLLLQIREKLNVLKSQKTTIEIKNLIQILVELCK